MAHLCSSPKTLLKTQSDAAQWAGGQIVPARGRVGATQRWPESTEAPPETGERCSSGSHLYLVLVWGKASFRIFHDQDSRHRNALRPHYRNGLSQ